MSAGKIRVLLADDHTMVRKGLSAILKDQGEIEVVGEAENGWQAVRRTVELRPDVVLIDLSMPELNGLDATLQIVKQVPGTKVLVLTRHANQEYAQRILDAGASGYLLKEACPEELVRAIQAVQYGDTYLDPAFATLFPGAAQSKPAAAEGDRYHRLTLRQREVLQLIAEGYANRDIAARLDVSVKTVENHRAGLMEALDLHSTAELTQYAIRIGMITLDE